MNVALVRAVSAWDEVGVNVLLKGRGRLQVLRQWQPHRWVGVNALPEDRGSRARAFVLPHS